LPPGSGAAPEVAGLTWGAESPVVESVFAPLSCTVADGTLHLSVQRPYGPAPGRHAARLKIGDSAWSVTSMWTCRRSRQVRSGGATAGGRRLGSAVHSDRGQVNLRLRVVHRGARSAAMRIVVADTAPPTRGLEQLTARRSE
jgi:hypothetical protein